MRFRFKPITEQRVALRTQMVRFEQPAAVLEILRQFCEAAGHHFWSEDISLRALIEPTTIITHAQITDAYLLGLAVRHGGGLTRVTLDERIEGIGPAEEVLALDKGLALLERHYPRKAQVVKLRYFAGFSVEETASLLGVSVGTVKLDWTFARAWLRRTLKHGPD